MCVRIKVRLLIRCHQIAKTHHKSQKTKKLNTKHSTKKNIHLWLANTFMIVIPKVQYRTLSFYIYIYMTTTKSNTWLWSPNLTSICDGEPTRKNYFPIGSSLDKLLSLFSYCYISYLPYLSVKGIPIFSSDMWLKHFERREKCFIAPKEPLFLWNTDERFLSHKTLLKEPIATFK